jgi:hypothetical protein
MLAPLIVVDGVDNDTAEPYELGAPPGHWLFRQFS